MCCKGFLKRVVPFFLTFAAGMFIASFFVTIAAPTSFSFRTNRGYRYAELQRLRIENRELRETNCRQRRELEELRRQSAAWDNAEIHDAVPPVNLDVPPPPPPPRAPKFIR